MEIRRGEGSGYGERTDIYIKAFTKNSRQEEEYDSITVIIETKGCWNKDLKTAMEDQLHDRYLNANQCNYGLYLVGWFMCDQWDDSDYKKSDTQKLKWSIENAQEELAKQAMELSREGKVIRSAVINTALR